MIIKRDNTQKREKYYAVTDKGVIWGGTKEIVERKIKRIGASEPRYGAPGVTRILEDKNDELPF
jgi:DNA-binding PadR family transcriptional regulator